MRLLLIPAFVLALLAPSSSWAADTGNLQKILDANLAAQGQNHTLPPLPSVEETEALLEPINEFYFRLWTLDPSFPDVFTEELRETQRAAMESFAARLMQDGTFERFTSAYVDVSSLHHYILETTPDSAAVKISGFLTVIIGGFEEDWEEDNQFFLSKEDGTWKIRGMKEDVPRYR